MVRRTLLVFAATYCLWCPAVSQGLDNLWQGGYETFAAPPWGGSDMNFDGGSPVISLQSRSIDLYQTSANIANEAGEMLFFTNGAVIGDANGDTLQNGSGLNPSEYTDSWYPEGLNVLQGDLILPAPDSPDHYYLFHNTIDLIPDFTTRYLYLTVIDMSLNGGLGAVTTKNQVIYDGDLQPGRLMAVRHGNGRDWWVYTHELNNDVFLRWLVTPDGVSGPTIQNVGIVRPPDAAQVTFSQNGERFAYYSGEFGLDLFAVDRCDGLFTLVGHADVADALYGWGVSFSPSGRFIYLSAQTKMYQVDAEASDLQTSLQLIAMWDSTYSPGPPFATLFGVSKLAPDGKIYVSTMNATDKLHVINSPDSSGVACDVVQHMLTLPTYWWNSIPNHPNYHLGALDGSPCDSLGLGVAEVTVDLNLSLYPNPNAGAFTLSFAPQPQAGSLEVIDMQGQVVHRVSVAPWSQLKRIHVPGLKSGMYECRLTSGASVAVRRFVVQ